MIQYTHWSTSALLLPLSQLLVSRSDLFQQCMFDFFQIVYKLKMSFHCILCSKIFSENEIQAANEAEAEKEKVVDITEDEEIDFGSEARKIIEALNVVGNGRATGIIVAMLKGHKNKSIWDKHTRAQVYGSGKDKTPAFWTSLVRELVSLSLLKEIKQTGLAWNLFTRTWTGIGITYKGHQFFRSNEKLMVKATGDLKPKQKKGS